MSAKSLSEFFYEYRQGVNPVTGHQRLFKDITDQMIWDAARKAPCGDCKFSNDKGEPSDSSFSNCHLCKHTHKDLYEQEDAPAKAAEPAPEPITSRSILTRGRLPLTRNYRRAAL